MHVKYRLAISVLACALALAISSSHMKQAASWQKVSDGLYMRQGHAKHGTFREYRSYSPQGKESLERMLWAKDPRVARIFIEKTKDQPHIQRASIGDCHTRLAFGEAGISYARAQLSVRCNNSTAVISGTLVIEPVLNTFQGGDYFYTGIGSLDVRESFKCTPDVNNHGYCSGGRPKAGNPGAWRTQEWWDADSGDSGYYCQSGEFYPDPC